MLDSSPATGDAAAVGRTTVCGFACAMGVGRSGLAAADLAFGMGPAPNAGRAEGAADWGNGHFRLPGNGCCGCRLASGFPINGIPLVGGGPPVRPVAEDDDEDDEDGENGSPVGLSGLSELTVATPGRTTQK
jgi:hypothetical protein